MFHILIWGGFVVCLEGAKPTKPSRGDGTGFGIGQTVHFSFINRNISTKQILLTCFILFPLSCLQTEESSQSSK